MGSLLTAISVKIKFHPIKILIRLLIKLIMLWLSDFDFYNVGKTLVIGTIVILITAILFYQIWLKNKYVSIPTNFGCYEYNFPANMGYYSKMRILLIDFSNHQYWITHVGLEG